MSRPGGSDPSPVTTSTWGPSTIFGTRSNLTRLGCFLRVTGCENSSRLACWILTALSYGFSTSCSVLPVRLQGTVTYYTNDDSCVRSSVAKYLLNILRVAGSKSRQVLINFVWNFKLMTLSEKYSVTRLYLYICPHSRINRNHVRLKIPRKMKKRWPTQSD